VPVAETQDEIRRDLFCQECGYNLRGLTGDRCPECGHSLEAVRSRVSRLPWVHRAELGRCRAYWRTVWFVMFRHKRFYEEVARPVSYTDAQRFRWVSVLHVYLPILAGTLLLYALVWPTPFEDAFFDEAFRAVWPMAVLHVCILLLLAAATGLPSYFFHPRDIPVEQQNRAIAMSYYACAALAWTPLAFVILLAGLVAIEIQWNIGEVLIAAAVCLPGVQMVAYGADLGRIGKRIMPLCRRRALLREITLPFMWLALAGLVLLGVPFVVFSLVVIVSGLF